MTSDKRGMKGPRQYDEPDYYNLEVPDDKDPSEYHYTERRAAILNLIIQRGSPYAIPTQTELAERYDVAQSSISKDLEHIRDHVDEHLGGDAKLTTRVVYERAVRELMDEGKHEEAFDIVMKWNKWLQDIGEQEQVASKHQVDADVTTREAASETDEYVLVEDADEALELDTEDAEAN